MMLISTVRIKRLWSISLGKVFRVGAKWEFRENAFAVASIPAFVIVFFIFSDVIGEWAIEVIYLL
jgi:hypothetical protein